MIAVAVLVTIVAVWGFFSAMALLQGEDAVTSMLAGLVILVILACAGGIIYGLYLVWEWAA